MIKNNIRKKGFTLIEILLIVFFVSLTFLGIYMMQGKTSDEVTINKEKEYILTLFDEIDRSASVLSRFQNISLQSLKENGYINKTNGFDLVSVTAPTPTRLEATYNNLKNKECSMFVSSIVNFSESYSAKINNIIIPSKADPKNITLECSADSNNVVIVRENNMFGVTLNTTLNGINNPTTGQNINTCPVGVCNTMTPVTPVPFTPITVAVNKPSVTIQGAVTTPTFTPGTPMVQPPVVPPVVTPPPPVVPPPVVPPPVVPPPVVPPPVVPPPPPPPVVTPPAGPTTPVPPPTYQPPEPIWEVPISENLWFEGWTEPTLWNYPLTGGELAPVKNDATRSLWYSSSYEIGGKSGWIVDCKPGFTPKAVELYLNPNSQFSFFHKCYKN